VSLLVIAGLTRLHFYTSRMRSAPGDGVCRRGNMMAQRAALFHTETRDSAFCPVRTERACAGRVCGWHGHRDISAEAEPEACLARHILPLRDAQQQVD
jgi:hypothetical protein